MVPRLQRPGFSVAFRIVVRIGGQAGCEMTAMSEREFRADIVTVGMSVLPAVCQILRSGKAGWCEKNIWYNLCSLNDRPHGSGRAVEAELKKKLLNYKATILWQRLLVLI